MAKPIKGKRRKLMSISSDLQISDKDQTRQRLTALTFGFIVFRWLTAIWRRERFAITSSWRFLALWRR
nr:hypothetical protein KV8917_900026 [Klebsiella variicola]